MFIVSDIMLEPNYNKITESARKSLLFFPPETSKYYTCIVLIQHYQQPISSLFTRNDVVYKIKSNNMYIVFLLNLLTLSINIDNNTKLFMGNYYIS